VRGDDRFSNAAARRIAAAIAACVASERVVSDALRTLLQFERNGSRRPIGCMGHRARLGARSLLAPPARCSLLALAPTRCARSDRFACGSSAQSSLLYEQRSWSSALYQPAGRPRRFRVVQRGESTPVFEVAANEATSARKSRFARREVCRFDGRESRGGEAIPRAAPPSPSAFRPRITANRPRFRGHRSRRVEKVTRSTGSRPRPTETRTPSTRSPAWRTQTSPRPTRPRHSSIGRRQWFGPPRSGAD